MGFSRRDFQSIDSNDLHIRNQNISYMRKTILVCVFLYSGFAFLDLLIYPKLFAEFAIIRFGIVVPYLLFTFFMSYTKFYIKHNQILTVFLYFFAGAGIVTMIFLIDGPNYYFSGLFIVFGVGFYLIRLRWMYSIMAFLLVMVYFIGGGMLYEFLSLEEVFVHSFFYFSFAIVGAFGSYFDDNYITSQEQFEIKNRKDKKELELTLTKQLQISNKRLEDVNLSHELTITSLATLAEARDNLTGDHLNRVGTLSYLLADAIPVKIYSKNEVGKQNFMKHIQLASIMHDIGKISVSDEILNKPSKLTKDEFEIIKTHSSIGASTLESIQKQNKKDNEFINLGIEIAKYHHERWDGTGYPTGIKGEEIPLSARIVALIDVYDALVSIRPYKLKFSKEKSLNIIKEGKGKHFDPELVEIFLNLAENSTDESLFWK